MNGIAKTVEQVKNIISPKEPATGIPTEGQGVHNEVYRYFNVASFDNVNQEHLATINDWALNGNDLGKGLKKIRSLELQLGNPNLGETRMSKLYNWIRMSDHINSTKKEMDTALGQVTERAKNNFANTKENYKERVGKLNSEIEGITKSYKSAIKNFQLNATEKAREIRDSYGVKLKELSEMRKAFKGGK